VGARARAKARVRVGMWVRENASASASASVRARMRVRVMKRTALLHDRSVHRSYCCCSYCPHSTLAHSVVLPSLIPLHTAHSYYPCSYALAHALAKCPCSYALARSALAPPSLIRTHTHSTFASTCSYCMAGTRTRTCTCTAQASAPFMYCTFDAPYLAVAFAWAPAIVLRASCYVLSDEVRMQWWHAFFVAKALECTATSTAGQMLSSLVLAFSVCVDGCWQQG